MSVAEPKIPALICEACGEEVLSWPGETIERARAQAARAYEGHKIVCRAGGAGTYRLVEREREHRR